MKIGRDYFEHNLQFLTYKFFIRNRLIMEAEAEAEAVALKGDAEAFAIEIKAKAEAEQMAMKADAFKEYGKAAKVYIIPSPFKNYPIRKRLLSGRVPDNNLLLSGTPSRQ